MATVEQLLPPFPRARFSFWGAAATLLLPAGSPDVRFEYLTEPPHGDPLYLVKVDRITVGGWKDPLPLFGRDLHLSDCAHFLALTSLRRTSGSAFHVLDLPRRRFWSAPGFVQLEAVSATLVTFRRYLPDGLNAKPGNVETAAFGSADWSTLTPGVA